MQAHHSTPLQPKANLRRRVAAPMALALAALMLGWLVPATFAYRIINPPDFAPEGALSADGRQVSVSGSYNCAPDEGESEIQVSLVQPATGAFARGRHRGACTGEEVAFVAEATIPADRPGFEAGPVQVCGLGQTFGDFLIIGEVTTGLAEYWCAMVTLSR